MSEKTRSSRLLEVESRLRNSWLELYAISKNDVDWHGSDGQLALDNINIAQTLVTRLVGQAMAADDAERDRAFAKAVARATVEAQTPTPIA